MNTRDLEDAGWDASRHATWREENFSVELEISPNNEQREKSQKYFRFHFRVQKILNDIFDSWIPPPLFLLLGQLLLSPRKRENRMSFERRASKTSKRGYSDENHGTRVSSPPSSPFFHTVSGTQETGQVSVHSFFSLFTHSRPARANRFLFPLLAANFPPRQHSSNVGRWNADDERRRRRRTWTSTFTAGCSFRSVKRVVLRGGRKKNGGDNIYIYVRFVKEKKRKCLV